MFIPVLIADNPRGQSTFTVYISIDLTSSFENKTEAFTILFDSFAEERNVYVNVTEIANSALYDRLLLESGSPIADVVIGMDLEDLNEIKEDNNEEKIFDPYVPINASFVNSQLRGEYPDFYNSPVVFTCNNSLELKGMGIVTGGSQPSLAKAFIDWFLTDKVQDFWSKQGSFNRVTDTDSLC